MTLVMDAKRAYVLLEIAYNEPIDKIKRAFKKLALKKHPDKNKNDPNANEKYMELQEAYKYLSNLKQDTNPNNNNKTASDSVLEQAQPNEFELKLTLEEIFRGCVKNPKITRKFLKNGQVKEEEKTLQVKISPGIATGARITVDKAGDSHIGRIPANVVFVVKEESHQYFRRSRFHLEYTARLTSAEACIGHVQIPTLENELVPLEVDELITPNTVKRIPERGMPHPSGNGPRGDIIVMFEIIYDSDKPQDPPMELDLLLTLEQILRGCTKNVKISRSIIDINGDERLEDVILTVDVQPGTEEGTKFKFVQKGDKRPETIPADIVFTTRDKPHPYFRRSDADVEHTIMITTQEAQTSGRLTFEVPTLESEKLNIELRGPITYGTNKKFIGYGLPYVDQPEKRGDLIVRFDIVKNDSIQPPMEYDLKLSLENILKGCTKRMKITRKIFDSDGNQMIDDKIVTIDVQPGTMAGTRYRFAREGDRLPGSIPADIVFIACDKPHDTFVRNGAHLEYVARMTHSTFSTGGDYKIPTLEDGIEETLKLDNIVKPTKTIRRFSGRGLPYENSPDIRGDLIVTLEIIENPQDPPLIHNLYLPAEQMRSGITKKLRITRRIIDIDGNEQSEGKVLAVEVAPKTVDGTKIVFPQIGDVRPGKIPSDVIFVIKSKLQDPPVERNIYIPLENILNGCTKRLKIKRLIANDEGEEEEEKIVTLNIKPGVEEGTKFTFSKEGDQIDRNRIPADVVFRVHSKAHDFLKRNGVDLEYVAKINRSDSINEAMLLIPNLDDENVMLKVDDQIGNGTVRRIRGKGLPFPNNANRRGDLVVRFEIENDDDDESSSDSEIYFA